MFTNVPVFLAAHNLLLPLLEMTIFESLDVLVMMISQPSMKREGGERGVLGHQETNTQINGAKPYLSICFLELERAGWRGDCMYQLEAHAQLHPLNEVLHVV